MLKGYSLTLVERLFFFNFERLSSLIYILKLFTRHYCTGVYFRVLETGRAKTGDIVQCEHKADHGISVKKLFRAFYDNKYPEALPVMKTALALPELAPEWQEKLQTRLSK